MLLFKLLLDLLSFPLVRSMQNQTFYPDVAGTYIVDIWFNDGCGANYSSKIVAQSLTPACPSVFSSTLTPSSTALSVTFDDKQTVRLSIVPPTYAAGFDAGAITTVWTISSAPNTSVYYPIDPPMTIDLSFWSNWTNSTTTSGNNITTWTSVQTFTDFKQTTQRIVQLDLGLDGDLSLWSTCFRPDIGGLFVATFSVYLNASLCPAVTTATQVTVTCGQPPQIPSSLQDWSVMVPRDKPTRVWLSAVGVTDVDTANESLSYNWQLLAPVTGATSPVDGSVLTIPNILAPRSMIASFWVPQANVKYVVQLSVSDGCNTVTKIVTITTQCSLYIPLDNKTLAATYDGQVPVTLMSFAYDHTQEISGYLSYPKCQVYSWQLVDYSTTISDSLLQSGSTEFVKTSGFAGLISAVVIVAVIVPIVVWMYLTKKGCFNKSDPRV